MVRSGRGWLSMLLLLTACSSPSPSPSVAPASSAPHAATSFEDGRCTWAGGAPIPGDETTANIDVNGDGELDVVRLYRDGPCHDLTSWRLTVAGAERDLTESFGSLVSAPYVLGGIDLDGDGAEEIWAHTSWDAISRRFALFTFRSGFLDYVRMENGAIAEWSVTDFKFPSGVACEPAADGTWAVVSYRARRESMGREPQEVSVLTYRLVGQVLVRENTATVPDDETATSHWNFECDAIRADG